MKKIFVCLSLISIALISCSKSNEVTESGSSPGTGGNPGDCDTVNMKYAANIQPIIQANCYGCHGNGQATNGVSLDSYSKLKARADNGQLIGVITHASGFPPMPYGKAKLSDCDINKIKAWIAQGTLDN